MKLNIRVQNLAYCRYLQIWSLLYFCNIVKTTPMISIVFTSFLHLYTLKCNTKRIGILAQDYILVASICIYNKKLYIVTNFLVFFYYINILILLNINPIKLYTKDIPKDDLKYKNENYCNYLKRIIFQIY
tara:strand:- start:204 stop:593 length:390 start_codon:yes stop_codon:yes gene_type:complete